MTEDEKIDIKEINMQIIGNKGYRYIDWLPILEDPNIRSLSEVKGRMAILLALVNISLDAPMEVIRDWLFDNNLSKHLSKKEESIFAKNDDEVTQDDKNRLRWYLEGLWALMWATNLTDELKENEWCGDDMASLLPNIENDDDTEKIDAITELRSERELYIMLDYHYRLHWYCVDERINGKQAKINEGIVYERRYVLEWLMDKDSDWDDVGMST